MQRQWTGTVSAGEHGAAGEDRGEPDRRNGLDRRSGLDRRGSGLHQPMSPEPRAYGFRDFRERRVSQDRRIWVSAADVRGRRDGIRRGWSDAAGGELFVRLTRDEIRVLLGSIDDWSDSTAS